MAASIVSSKQKWKEFFTRYYKPAIQQLAVSDAKTKSLVVEFQDIVKFDVRLSEELLSNPGKVLKDAEDSLHLVDLPVKRKVTAFVRVARIPRKTQVRDLRSDHINTLISIDGTVRKITDVRPRIINAAFECARCGNVVYIPQEGTGKFLEPSYCNCNEEKKGVFRLLFKESSFEDYQRVKIQESPEDLKGGEQPQTLDINVNNDLAGVVTPGERIVVNGILRSVQKINKDGKTVYFDIFMDCNSLEQAEQEFDELEITPEEEETILKLSKSPDIFQKFTNSIAPSIYGYDEVKEAVALQLFSGIVKNLPDGTRIRGDIHVLLVGDPGIAKSQILRYVVNLAPRGVYASGKSASSAGLTAAAVKDDFDGSWTLEAGALVLADKGVAAIDEIDKMKAEDRSSLHEAMEQQSYHPLTEILLADGRKVRIGEYVDRLINDNKNSVIGGVNCEILPLNGEVSIYSLSDNETIKLPVDRVSRHSSPDHFIKLKYSNGREIIVTPDHPVFVMKNGVYCVPAKNVKPGDFVPAPRALPPGENEPELIFVDKLHEYEKDLSLPAVMSPKLSRILGYLATEGHFYRGSSHEVGFTNKDTSLLNEMKALMREVFHISPSENERHIGVIIQRYISTRLCRWFEANFQGLTKTSRHKRIPYQLFRSTKESIREFLCSAFLGDGCVHSSSVGYSTASRGLAKDYQDLLLMVGISSHIYMDRMARAYKVCILGDSNGRFVELFDGESSDKLDRMRQVASRGCRALRHHDVFPTDTAHQIIKLRKAVGLTNDGYFNQHIDKGYGLTVDVVGSYTKEIRERYDDVKPLIGQDTTLPSMRNTLGWSQNYMANIAGLTRGNVDYLENGGYPADKRERLNREASPRINKYLESVDRSLSRLEHSLRSNVRYLRVTDVFIVPNAGEFKSEYVYDITVEPTHSFISQGVLLHNSISVAKAGILATLKCRCALLGAANPKLGRFDPFDNISEQINMPPSLMSRFDLIFILQDRPDEKRDANIAGHILKSHYAGELNAHRTHFASSHVTEESLAEAIKPIKPEIDSTLLRKYIAYAKRKIFPIMTDEARQSITKFYLELRKPGESEGSPIAVTARQLEGLVRLSEASARMRLSDKVTPDDVERTINIVMTSLKQVGMDNETGKLDIDILTVGVGRSQRERIKDLKNIIMDLAHEYSSGGVPLDRIVEKAGEHGLSKEKVEKEIKKLKEIGEIFEPKVGYYSHT